MSRAGSPVHRFLPGPWSRRVAPPCLRRLECRAAFVSHPPWGCMLGGPAVRDNVDQAKIAQPTAAAATNSLPRSSLPPTTPANASPTQAAAPSNPHRRQPSTRRPAGSFLGGFRTPNLAAHANRHDRPASETLHQNCHSAGTCRRAGLLLAWVVGGVDVVDASWPNELNLKDRLLASSPSVMRMFCRIHPH